MNASQPTKAVYFNYIGSIELPLDVIEACYHSGPCDDDIANCRLLPEVIAELKGIDPEALKKELAEYGAWDDLDLANHDENLNRILWIAVTFRKRDKISLSKQR